MAMTHHVGKTKATPTGVETGTTQELISKEFPRQTAGTIFAKRFDDETESIAATIAAKKGVGLVCHNAIV